MRMLDAHSLLPPCVVAKWMLVMVAIWGVMGGAMDPSSQANRSTRSASGYIDELITELHEDQFYKLPSEYLTSGERTIINTNELLLAPPPKEPKESVSEQTAFHHLNDDRRLPSSESSVLPKHFKLLEFKEKKSKMQSLEQMHRELYGTRESEYTECLNNARERLRGKPLIVETLVCLRANTTPPLDENGIVAVTIALEVNEIFAIEHNGTFRLAVTLVVQWKDERLAYLGNRYLQDWDSASNYVEMPNASVLGEQIWLPDLYPMAGQMGNTTENENWLFQPRVFDTYFAQAKGWNVSWERMLTLSSNCSFFFEWYPFDSQVCRIVFSTWNSQSSLKNIVHYRSLTYGDITAYSLSRQVSHVSLFKVVHGNVSVTYDNESENNNVAYTFLLERKPHYYVHNFIWPCQVILLISYVSLWLPSYWYDRVSMTVPLLLSIFQIMGTAAGDRPPFGFDTWIDSYIAYIVVLCLIPPLEVIGMNATIVTLRERLLAKERRSKWMKYYLLKNATADRFHRIKMEGSTRRSFYSNSSANTECEGGSVFSMTDSEAVSCEADIGSSAEHSGAKQPLKTVAHGALEGIKVAMHLAFIEIFPILAERGYRLGQHAVQNGASDEPWKRSADLWNWNTSHIPNNLMDYIHHTNFEKMMLASEIDFTEAQLDWTTKKMANIIDSMIIIIYPGIICALLFQSYSVFASQSSYDALFFGNSSIVVFSSVVVICFYILWVWALHSHVMLAISDPEIGPALGVGEKASRWNSYLMHRNEVIQEREMRKAIEKGDVEPFKPVISIMRYFMADS